MNLKNISKDKLKIVAATAGLALVFIAIMITVVIGVTSQIDTSTPDEIAYVQVVTTKPAETTEPETEETTTESEIEETITEDVVPEVEYELKETCIEDNEYAKESDYSDYELDLLARVIYQEAGICGEYCQWLVGSTVLNLADERDGIEAVVFDYDTFNVAYVLYDAEPSDLSYSVANRLLSGDRDYNVKAFRMDYYHDFGAPYTNVDGVYFSTY